MNRQYATPVEMGLAGETLIPNMPCHHSSRKSKTIRDIAHALTEGGRSNTWNKRLKIRTVDRDGTIRATCIRHAAMTGREPAYRVTTIGPMPRTLIATGNHPVLTPRGYRGIGQLVPGDKVLANGVAVPSHTQLHSLWDEGYRMAEIGQVLGVSETTALHRLRAAGVDTSRRTGFTRLCKPDHELSNPHGRSSLLRKPCCEVCGEPARHVHHFDENPYNNSAENLISLCIPCHRAFHNDPFQLRVYETAIASVEPVGIIDVYALDTVDGGLNFVANGLVVQNCEFNT